MIARVTCTLARSVCRVLVGRVPNSSHPEASYPESRKSVSQCRISCAMANEDVGRYNVLFDIEDGEEGEEL